jgi:PHD/YefM family antitoxin component YafN of YafNO toxin-antitoxin module
MMLSKRESNTIYETIVKSQLDPAEFDLEDTGEKVVITHNSGSRFEFSPSDRIYILSDERTGYDVRTSVAEGVNETHTAPDVKFLTTVYIPLWLKEIELTVGVPDHWAELRRNRQSVAIIQRGDFENTSFTRDEQEQIAAQLQEIKKQVKEQFAFSNEQIERAEESLDELTEASKRMGRKDWLIYFLGTITALIITATVTAGAGEQISAMVIHGLIHLFSGGSEPPRILT